MRRAGVEPAQPEASGLRPPRLANAQPTHVCFSGSRGTRTHNGTAAACFQDRFLIQPDDFRGQAAVAGIEPASGRLTAAYPYQHGSHRITSARTAGFEPAVSCARSRRNTSLSYVLRRTRSRERPAGVEPALPPWQGDRLPLHHGRRGWKPNCQRTQSTGRDSNPRHRSTGAASSPLDHQCV